MQSIITIMNKELKCISLIFWLFSKHVIKIYEFLGFINGHEQPSPEFVTKTENSCGKFAKQVVSINHDFKLCN